MSYSECLACGNMVGGHQKYCEKCLDRYKLRQGDWRTFKLKTGWNSPGRDAEIRSEIAKDTKFPVDLALELYSEATEQE